MLPVLTGYCRFLPVGRKVRTEDTGHTEKSAYAKASADEEGTQIIRMVMIA